MSYCRWGTDSNVYIISTGKSLCCVYCAIYEKDLDFTCENTEDMIKHLKQHVAAGDKVPARAFERLEKESKNEQ